jgi:LysR family transcriptional regulator, hypochlorite-specific transcription factor HypT
MEIKWLEDFLSLARTGNFSQSAIARNVTQSTLSRRIKAIERWLGVALVDRSTYPTRLTDAGAAFRSTAEDLLRRLYQDREQLRQSSDRLQDQVSFSAMHTLSLSFFPTWLTSLENAIGPLNSRLIADNIHNCVELLVDGSCEFLLCFAHDATPVLIDEVRYPYAVLGSDKLMPVSSVDRSRRPRFCLSAKQSAPAPYLAYAPESLLGRAVEQRLQAASRRCHLAPCYVNSMAEALRTMAVHGHGLAWLPQMSIRGDLRGGRLARAGDERWDIALEIRLYRSLGPGSAQVEAIWAQVLAD